MEILLVWVVLAFIVGAGASGRGRSFAAWTLIAILISPLLALILLVVLPNVTEQRTRDAVMTAQLAATRAAAETSKASGDRVEQSQPSENVLAIISSLADLRDRGVITAEEYETKKTGLLARL